MYRMFEVDEARISLYAQISFSDDVPLEKSTAFKCCFTRKETRKQFQSDSVEPCNSIVEHNQAK